MRTLASESSSSIVVRFVPLQPHDGHASRPHELAVPSALTLHP
jgi:hypothetical protein